MQMAEYQQVKDFTYEQYCDHLQAKYGIGLADYMTKSFNINSKCQRTKDGLIAHHKKEDTTTAILSMKVIAMRYPFDWQMRENIVYCDYLEHLLLHVLICKYLSSDEPDFVKLGINYVVDSIVSELNDVYSGWVARSQWRSNCHEKIINDKAVYLEILRKFIEIEKMNSDFSVDMLCESYNKPVGLWSDKKNEAIYDAIRGL